MGGGYEEKDLCVDRSLLREAHEFNSL